MLEQRSLGSGGPDVGRIGYGAMVLEGFYGESDDAAAINTVIRALDMGINMLDSADAYGNGHNESLVGQALKGRRDQAFLATKFGIVFDEKETGTELPTGWGFSLNINGTPAYAKRSLDASLKRLGTDVVDLWYVHYADPGVPIEETVGAMAECVTTGEVRYLGLCNVTSEEVRRAHTVQPLSAVQYEYSLWRRGVEDEPLPTLRELGIALVCWSPLGSGFLTGTVDGVSALVPNKELHPTAIPPCPSAGGEFRCRRLSICKLTGRTGLPVEAAPELGRGTGSLQAVGADARVSGSPCRGQ